MMDYFRGDDEVRTTLNTKTAKFLDSKTPYVSEIPFQ